MPDATGYYQRDLAVAHHRGFGFHAAACAPGILDLLQPVQARRGLVLELGCGSGLLTRELVAAGHHVVATDASAAMLEIAREVIGDAAEVRQLTLPDDPLPALSRARPWLLSSQSATRPSGRRWLTPPPASFTCEARLVYGRERT